MARMLLMSMLVSVCAYSFATAVSAQQMPDNKNFLEDCLLAGDMIKANYMTKPVEEDKSSVAETKRERATLCLNYIVGFKDALFKTKTLWHQNGGTVDVILPNNNLSDAEALEIVLKYLTADYKSLVPAWTKDERADMPRYWLVFHAFFREFGIRQQCHLTAPI